MEANSWENTEMAMKVEYYTVRGQMIGYDDGSQKDFLTDALGSVTAEVDQSCVKLFNGRYKPYGDNLSLAGSRGKFGWLGIWGYSGTGLAYSSHYVRTRFYSQSSGTWSSVDLNWSMERAYGYVHSRPTILMDYYGLSACNEKQCCCDLGTPTQTYEKLEGVWERGHLLFGHKLITTVSMNPKEADEKGTCEMQWWEKSSAPNNTKIPADTWINVCDKKYKELMSCPETTFYEQVPKSCSDHPKPWSDTDKPTLYAEENRGRTSRKLCIMVYFKDGCTKKWSSYKFNQYISILDKKMVTITPGPANPLVDKYCGDKM